MHGCLVVGFMALMRMAHCNYFIAITHVFSMYYRQIIIFNATVLASLGGILFLGQCLRATPGPGVWPFFSDPQLGGCLIVFDGLPILQGAVP